MKITVLASGSKGNSTLIETKTNNILIDAGLSLKTLEKRFNKELPHIDTLIITHTHSDHIKGINSIIKKYQPNIHTLAKNLSKVISYDNISYDKQIALKETNIELFELSHDVPCTGLLLENNGIELLYITDTGYIKNKILKEYGNKDIYIIESNYEEEKLKNGSYPFYLKQRIRSDKGHLSNSDTNRYLKTLIGQKTKYILLAHLSEENNDPKIVKQKANETLNSLNNNITKVIICSQTEKKELQIQGE